MKQQEETVINDHYYTSTPVLFLDLDGTVRESASGKKFIKDDKDIKIKDGVIETIRKQKEKGYLVIAVTNQGAVAYGLKTEEDVRQELVVTNALCDDLFDFMLYCPFHPDGSLYPYNNKSLARKPDVGMIMQAEARLLYEHDTQIDYTRSLFVGDRQEDKQCAFNAGIKFVWESEFFSFARTSSLHLK